MSASSTAAHRHFHDDLSELKAKLLTMSGEAQDALGRALDALLRATPTSPPGRSRAITPSTPSSSRSRRR